MEIRIAFQIKGNAGNIPLPLIVLLTEDSGGVCCNLNTKNLNKRV